MACGRILHALLMAGQLAAAGLLIGLVATKLNNIKMSFDPEHLSAKVTDTCLLGAASNGVNLCYVAYGVGGVSILATAALSVLMCCTCNLCGLGFLLDTIFALVGTAWWALAGVLYNYYTQQPDIVDLPQAEWRRWVVLLCWIGCAFFGAALLVNLYRILAKCCGCLTCGGGEGRRDMEKGYGGRAAYMPTQFTPAGAPPPGYFGRGGRQGQFVAY